MKKITEQEIGEVFEKVMAAGVIPEAAAKNLIAFQPDLAEYLFALGDESKDVEKTTGFLFNIFYLLSQIFASTGIEPQRPDFETIFETEEFLESELDSILMEPDQAKARGLYLKFKRTHPQPEMVELIFSVLPRPEDKPDELDHFTLMVSLLTVLNTLCGIKPPQKNKGPEWSGIQDLRIVEQGLDNAGRASRKHNFTTIEEANAYFKENLTGKKIEPFPPATPREEAQDLIYKAMAAQGDAAKAELARAALKVYPDCADAYNLLAEQAEDYDAEAELYGKAVEAGERALGKDFFAENEGHFWGEMIARPYMRARLGLAVSLWDQDKLAGAEANFYALLRLNKNDNQGVRYTLLQFHSENGEWEKAHALINNGDYPDDCAAEWLYTRALTAYALKKPGAEAFLAAAMRANPFAPDYLLGEKPIPRRLPDLTGIGDETEAFCYAANFLDCWREVPGAVDWLAKEAAKLAVPKAGRNEPCPCGSGRKYKKCCGKPA